MVFTSFMVFTSIWCCLELQNLGFGVVPVKTGKSSEATFFNPDGKKWPNVGLWGAFPPFLCRFSSFYGNNVARKYCQMVKNGGVSADEKPSQHFLAFLSLFHAKNYCKEMLPDGKKWRSFGWWGTFSAFLGLFRPFHVNIYLDFWKRYRSVEVSEPVCRECFFVLQKIKLGNIKSYESLTHSLPPNPSPLHEQLRPWKKNRSSMHSLNALFYASHFCQQREELYQFMRSVCVLAVI